MMMHARLIVGLAGLAVAQFAATAPLKPGLWEVLVQTDLAGAASSPSRVCITQKDVDDSSRALPKPAASCGVVAPKVAGDKTSYDVVCPGPNPMRGHAEINSTPTAYNGTVQMTMKVEPNKPERAVKFTFAGSRVGDCAGTK